MSNSPTSESDRDATLQVGALQAHTAEADGEADPPTEASATPPRAHKASPHTEDTLGVTLSTRFQSDPVEVATDHTPATIRIHQDHDSIRLEAIEATDRTVEAVLRGSPAAMTALADRLYAAAEQTVGGDRNG